MLRGLIFYALVAVAVPMSFFQPIEGVLFYLFFAHGHPADFMWPGFVFNYGLFVGGALMAGYVIFEVRKSPLLFRGMLLILAFWAWLTAASWLAMNRDSAFYMLSRFNKIFVISMLVAAMANSEERIGRMLRVIAGCVGVLGAKGFIDVLKTGGKFRMQGPGGLLAEENEYAMSLNMSIPILFFMASIEERVWVKRFYQFAAIGCAATVIFTRSRSGLLGLIIVALLLTVYARRKTLAIPGLAVGVVLFIMFAPDAAIQRYKTISTASESDASAIGRLQMWETAIAIAKAHPFFGVGLRNFEAAVPSFSNYEPRAPHNAFMALTAESGIPSCLLFISIVLGGSRRSWLNWRKLRRDPDSRRLATYCLIVHTTLLAYIVPNFFINRQDYELMYHLVGVGAGMNLVVRRKLLQRQETNTLGFSLAPMDAPALEPAAALAEST